MIAETQAWLNQQLQTIDMTGTSSMDISINANSVSVTAWSTNGMRVRIGTGQTLDQALADLRKKLPASEARQLRNEAEDMIKLAEKLEGQ